MKRKTEDKEKLKRIKELKARSAALQRQMEAITEQCYTMLPDRIIRHRSKCREYVAVKEQWLALEEEIEELEYEEIPPPYIIDIFKIVGFQKPLYVKKKQTYFRVLIKKAYEIEVGDCDENTRHYMVIGNNDLNLPEGLYE